MKKLISLISIFVCAFAVFSCSDDEMTNPYAKESQVTIESTDVFFQAAPAEGTISVSIPSGIYKVETTAHWCSATYSGNTIYVTVEQNAEKSSRVCRVRIYASEDDYKEVTVQQMGLIFQVEGLSGDISSDDNSNRFAYKYRANSETTIETVGDFFTAELTEDSLIVTLQENNTGKIRTGYINYVVGGQPGTIKVQQYDYEKDVLGEYTLYYGTSGTSTADCVLQRDAEGAYSLKFDGGVIPISVTSMELDGAKIQLSNREVIGNWTYNTTTTENAILLLWYLSGSSIYRSNTDFTLSATSALDEESGTLTWTFDEFFSSGNTCYRFSVVNTTAKTYATYTAIIQSWIYPDRLVKK